MSNSSFYSDNQFARLAAATQVFGVRPDGYFREQATRKAAELKNDRKSITKSQLKKAVRTYMGKLSRKIFSEIDAHADKIVNKDIKAACELAGINEPDQFNCDFEALILSGDKVIASNGHSKSIKVATDVLSGYLSRIDKVVSTMPKKKMAKINIKVN
jgi:hypothetical protein